MNKSTIFLVVAIAIIIAFILGTLITVTTMMKKENKQPTIDTTVKNEQIKVETKTNFSDFTIIDIEGYANVTIEQGEIFSVEKNSSLIQLKQEGNELKIEVEKKVFYKNENLNVKIIMPYLEKVSLEGAMNFELNNFNQESFALEAEGAVKFNSKNSDFKNVRLDIEGACKIDVKITEGSIYGKVEGASKINIYGKNIQNNIEKHGINKIKIINQ